MLLDLVHHSCYILLESVNIFQVSPWFGVYIFIFNFHKIVYVLMAICSYNKYEIPTYDVFESIVITASKIKKFSILNVNNIDISH